MKLTTAEFTITTKDEKEIAVIFDLANPTLVKVRGLGRVLDVPNNGTRRRQYSPCPTHAKDLARKLLKSFEE